jgi:hypothetical protein
LRSLALRLDMLGSLAVRELPIIRPLNRTVNRTVNHVL